VPEIQVNCCLIAVCPFFGKYEVVLVSAVGIVIKCKSVALPVVADAADGIISFRRAIGCE
jgi:hypothetical protein